MSEWKLKVSTLPVVLLGLAITSGLIWGPVGPFVVFCVWLALLLVAA